MDPAEFQERTEMVWNQWALKQKSHPSQSPHIGIQLLHQQRFAASNLCVKIRMLFSPSAQAKELSVALCHLQSKGPSDFCVLNETLLLFSFLWRASSACEAARQKWVSLFMLVSSRQLSHLNIWVVFHSQQPCSASKSIGYQCCCYNDAQLQHIVV